MAFVVIAASRALPPAASTCSPARSRAAPQRDRGGRAGARGGRQRARRRDRDERDARVVYPHMCGLGGDLFLLHREARTGEVHCLNGTARAGAATPGRVRRARPRRVPVRGPLSVTVPGTRRRVGSGARPFRVAARSPTSSPRRSRAREDGIDVTARIAGWIAESRDDLAPTRRSARGSSTRRRARPARGPRPPARARRDAERLRRRRRRRPLRAASSRRRDRRRGRGRRRPAAPEDLAATRPSGSRRAPAPRRARRRHDAPNSQGVTALLMSTAAPVRTAAAGTARPPRGLRRRQALRAFAARDAHRHRPGATCASLAEPSRRTAPPAPPPPSRPAARRATPSTLCAVDAEGNTCSMIQSLYYGFGSCFVAGAPGLLMHNRAPLLLARPTARTSSRRQAHAPHAHRHSMALEDGRPRFVFGRDGRGRPAAGDVQVLERLPRRRERRRGRRRAAGPPRALRARGRPRRRSTRRGRRGAEVAARCWRPRHIPSSSVVQPTASASATPTRSRSARRRRSWPRATRAATARRDRRPLREARGSANARRAGRDGRSDGAGVERVRSRSQRPAQASGRAARRRRRR